MLKKVICILLIMVMASGYSFKVVYADEQLPKNIADEIADIFLDNPMITKTDTVKNVVGDGSEIIGVNGKIFCFGSDMTLIYDIDKEEWSTCDAMPIKRIDYSLVEVDSNIYFISGTLVGESNTTKRIDKFNTVDLTWSTVTNIPNNISGATASAVGNKIYCCGLNSYMYIFDTINNSWTNYDGIPYEGEYTSAAIGDKIYYTSVETKFGNRTFEFDTSNLKWRELQLRPNYVIDNTAIGKYKLFRFNDILLCLEYGGAEKINSKVRYAYIPKDDTWVVLPDKIPDLTIENSAFTVYKNHIFVLTDDIYSDGSIRSRITVTYFINHKKLYTYKDTIAVGKRHILNYSNGILMAKGDNTYGQLGDGTTNSSDKFVEVQMPWTENDETVMSVAAGGNMSYVITNKYNLYVWGQNDSSQLGNKSVDDVLIPTLVEKDVIKVAAGEAHTLILKRDTSVWASGNNSYGQLGNNSTSTKRKFIKVAEDGFDIEAGRYQSFIIDLDGNLKGCGGNGQGELGLSSGSVIKVFTDIMNNVETVSSGYSHSIAVDNSGSVYVWGNNTLGQLGLSAEIKTQNTPYKLTNVNAVSMAKAGGNTTVYVKGGFAYQCGYMGYENKCNFIKIADISNVKELAAGDLVFAKTQNDDLYKWGLETYSQNFDTSSNDKFHEPVKIADLFVSDLSSKRTQTLAISCDKENVHQSPQSEVVEWGRGYFGTGSDQEEIYSYPKLVKDQNGLTLFGYEVMRGKNHNLIVVDSGDSIYVYGWGSNTNYPMGENLEGKVRYPAKTVFSSKYLEDGDGYEYPDHIICELTAGAEFSIGTFHEYGFSSNEVYSWNNTYAMGKGYTDKSGYPTDSNQYQNNLGYVFTSLEAGYNFAALMNDENQLTFKGEDDYWQHGTGMSDEVYRIFDAYSDEYFTEVKCGPYFCIGLTNMGNVYSWGKNSMGQLGLGYRSEKSVPKKINGLTNVISLGVGHDHAMAIKSDGTVWTWGNNSKHQLGRDVGLNNIPGQVLGITNAKEVTGGYEYTIVVDNDNRVWTFGSNEFGALGIYRNAAKQIYEDFETDLKADTFAIRDYSNNDFSLRKFMNSDETVAESNGYIYEKIDGIIRRRKANV